MHQIASFPGSPRKLFLLQATKAGRRPGNKANIIIIKCTFSVVIVKPLPPTTSRQELAEIEGDRDKMSTLAQQLEELEERADQLDKQRTKGLSAIRSFASSVSL